MRKIHFGLLIIILVFLLAAPVLAKPCPTCGGSGTITVTCPVCGGTGISGYVDVNGATGAYGCENCGGVRGDPAYGTGRPGSGYVTETCPDCGGSGEVPDDEQPAQEQPQEETTAPAPTAPTAPAAQPAHQIDFEKIKADVLKNIKGITENELGLKGENQTDLGLKEAGEQKEVSTANNPNLVTNPQIVKIVRGIKDIVVPSPITPEQGEVSFKLRKPEDKGEKILTGTDYGMTALELGLTLAGKTMGGTPKLVLAAGKTILAQEGGAEVYIVKQNQLCEQALGYLKTNPREFNAIVKAIRDNKPMPEGSDPSMVKAAKAMLDPNLGNSGMKIAWNAMWSPEAKSAALSRACLELGGELLGRGTEGVVSDIIAGHDPAFKQAVEAIDEATAALKTAKTAAEKTALKQAIAEANTIMVRTYKAGSGLVATGTSMYAGSKAEERTKPEVPVLLLPRGGK